ncbi:MAG TPA: dihydrodipicolinate synthase family protein [Terriglobia bacterium]|nr:dihydrodipicolinate synthase family protein [Terriglobia bacterium]
MSYQDVRNKLVGPMETVPTVFDSNGKLDLAQTADVINFMVDRGIRNGSGFLLVGGAVGQFAALATEERKSLAEACVKTADGRVPVVVSCQTTCTDHSIDLAKHAVSAGADAIQLSPPHYYFYPQLSQDDVIQYFDDVAKEADIAIVAYHNWWSSVGIAPSTLAKMADEIPNLVGVKWRGRDDYETYLGYKLCAHKLSMIENALHLTLTTPHQMGARAFVTYIGIVWPEYDLELWRLLESKDYAKASSMLLSLAVPLYELAATKVRGEHSNVMAELRRLAGFPAWTPRRPTRPVPPEASKELEKLFAQAGAPFLKKAKD